MFVIWSATGFVLEVPSGIWADAVSRRALLTLAPLLSGAGFGLWVLAPSYETFAIGFVLWGAQGALQSGALEALVYEELERTGAEGRYAHLMGRATALGTVASGVATGLAVPVFGAGGFGAVGAGSVLACVAAAAVGATLPEHRSRAAAGEEDDEERGGWRGHVAIVAAGARELRGSRTLRGAVLLVPAVVTVWGALDEYLPLLASEAGAAPQQVALLGLLVYGGVAAGGMLAGRAARLRGCGLGCMLAAAAALLAAGALVRAPAGFAAITVAFALFQAVTIVVDARLQQAIEGRARSTVTSLAGLLTEVATIATFTVYAAGSAALSHAMLFGLCAAAYLLVAPFAARVVDRVR